MKRTAAILTVAALTITLAGPASAAVPDPTPPKKQTVQKDAREARAVALNRPSRGGSARIIQKAATVPPKWRGFAACVLSRESGGSLDRIQSGVGARNPNSSASGRWQFLDNSWRRGLSFMVRDRLIQFGMPKAQARQVRLYLGARPISQWHGYWQDIGFNEVIERGGSYHWNGGSHSC
jgi:hypothetical protein